MQDYIQGRRKTLCFRVYESPPQEMCGGVWNHSGDREHDKSLIRAQLWSTHNVTAFSPCLLPSGTGLWKNPSLPSHSLALGQRSPVPSAM